MGEPTEFYAKVPESLILGPCDGCLRLFALLDLEQGADGRPYRGVRAAARDLGWGRNRVRRHLEHLAAHGLVKLELDGNRKEVFRVANPARSGSTTDPPVGPPRTHPQRKGGSTTDPLSRSYRSEIGVTDSDLDDSRDLEPDEIERLAAGNGHVPPPLEEPPDLAEADVARWLEDDAEADW